MTKYHIYAIESYPQPILVTMQPLLKMLPAITITLVSTSIALGVGYYIIEHVSSRTYVIVLLFLTVILLSNVLAKVLRSIL